jgi:hypothetical protein
MEYLTEIIVIIAATIAMSLNEINYYRKHKALKETNENLRRLLAETRILIAEQANTINFVKTVRDSQAITIREKCKKIDQQNYILKKLASVVKSCPVPGRCISEYNGNTCAKCIAKFYSDQFDQDNQPTPEFRDLKTIVSSDLIGGSSARMWAGMQQQAQAQAMNRNRSQGGSIFGP